MKLHGLLVVQDESDIIEDLLDFLKNLNIYNTILFFDLGSKDETFEKALKFKDMLCKPQKLTEIYTEKLRFDLLEQHRGLYQEGDWLSMIDADEFYADNPMDLIHCAEQEGATFIQTYQAQFLFTDQDLKEFDQEDQSLPIYERRRYYLINYSEERFFKFFPEKSLFSRAKPCTRRLLNRHYQFRTPCQIKSRVLARLQNRKSARKLRGRHEWPQIFSSNWKDYVVSHKIAHKFTGGELRFGLPRGVRWKDYFSNDPFSPILPQVAQLLAIERTAKPGESLHSEYAIFDPGRITFEECFSQRVLQDIRRDFSNRQMIEVLLGLVVLLRYHLRKFRDVFIQNILMVYDKLKAEAGNKYRTLLRFLRGKSRGRIIADPNPIQISDNSGVGTTTLRWNSSGTETVEVHVDHPDGQIFHQTGPSGVKPTENWVSNNMVFFLQDVSNDLPLTEANTLSKVTVKVLKGKKITI